MSYKPVLAFISTTSFSDVDLNILKLISSDFNIKYYVLLPSKNSNFTKDEISSISESIKIDSFYLKLKFRRRNPILIIDYIKFFLKINNSKPDLIVINNDDFFFNCCTYLFNKKKCLISIHDVVNHKGLENVSFFKNIFFSFSKKLLINRFDKFLTYSNSQSILLRKLKPNSEIFSIPMPLKEFHKKTTICRSNKINLLFFGNIQPYKGLSHLLITVNQLSKIYSNFNLIIAGRCENWDLQYGHLIKNQNTKLYIRFINNDEIPNFFSNSHYLILPYLNATQSGIIQIAYNYNIPIIASNLDSFKEFIKDGVSGYIYDSNVEGDLYKLLERILNKSESEYSKLAQQTSKFVRDNFSNSIIKAKYIELIDNLIK